MNFLQRKNKNQEPYYTLLTKIHLLLFIPDIDSVDIISDYMYSGNCIVVKCKNRIFRSLKIIDIDFFLFNKIRLTIEKLIGFNLSQKKIDYGYSKDELDVIKLYGNGKINNIVLVDTKDILCENEEIMYDELCMMDIPSNNTYKIIKLVTKVKVKYDYVCGMDIMLILMKKIYDIKYKKITKATREKLKEQKFRVFVL